MLNFTTHCAKRFIASCAALAGGGGGGAYAHQPAAPDLTRLIGVWPYSTMSTLTGDEAGHFMFICEGGVITFADLRGVDRASDPAVMNPFYESTRIKRVRAGKQGVRAAALALDPDANLLLDTDVPTDGLASNDREDLLFIAGGPLGLWVMRAETTVGNSTWNTTVRLDDASDVNSPAQDSRRYCNQLEFAWVDGQRYLLATFGEKDGGSRLRFYDLDAVRDRLDWPIATPPSQLQADGTGYELAATWEVALGERPGFPFQNPGRTFSEAFPLGIAVDHPPSSPGNCAAVYVAMGPHGVVRATPVVDPSTQQVTGWSTSWGPVFGDGSHYAQIPQTGQLYWNLDYRDMSRSVHFDHLDRSEPPFFTDVAVQHDVIEGDESTTLMRYLYCTVDHLNWVRFNLQQAWSSTMPIDHQEGDPIAIERKPHWHGLDGLSPQSSYGTWKEMVRATDLPPFDTTTAGANRMDTTFARRVELVDPPPGSARKHKLVVVTASGYPFLGASLPMAPRGNYSHTFTSLAGINLASANHLTGYSLQSTTIVYDSSALSANRNEIGYVTSGGLSLYVPPDQSTTGGSETLKFFHNNQADGDSALPFGAGQDLLNESCVTFYDLASPPSGVGAPVFVRDSTAHDHKGRYNNGIGYCISDPRILTSSHNDGLPFMDGILFTRSVGNELAVGPATPPPLPPNANDRRMDTGIVCPQNNQWETPGDDPATPSVVHHYFVGQGAAAFAQGGGAVTGWSVVRHQVDQNPTPPLPVSIAEDWTRVFDLPLDRFQREARRGYLNASTSGPEFTAWATARASGSDPIDYAFLASGGTSDGLVVVDRTRLLTDVLLVGVANLEPQSGTRVSLPFPAKSELGNQFVLNTHPEWDPIPSASAPGEASTEWWKRGIEQPGTSLTWTPTLVRYPEAVSGASTPTEEWLLAVPCFTLGNSHAQYPIQALAGTVLVTEPPNTGLVDLDARFANTWFAPQNIDPETAYLMGKYSHGLVQFWRFTSLPKEQDDFPGGHSDLPFIVLPDPGTCAWRIETVVVGVDEGAQVLLFVADFGGHVYVYDITDVPDLPRSSTGLPAQHLLATWTAPAGPLDNLHSNVRALAVDKVDDDLVAVYAGVPGHGIEILRLRRTPSTDAWAFDNVTTRIETPGDAYGLTIRPAFPALGLPKTLLVSDAFGGLRFYGEELP